MSQQPAEKPVADMTFEEAMSALDQIVRELEAGRAPLEKSIAIYERGAALKAHCEQKLNSAEARIRKLTVDADGRAKAEPFGDDA